MCTCSACLSHGLVDQEDVMPYSEYEDYELDYEAETPVNNDVKETSMSVPGDTFTTGNSIVADLPVGTVLTVVGDGELEITEVPAPASADHLAGQRILTHHGPATVVRQSSRLDIALNEDEILYVADSDPVVRRIFTSEVTFI